MITNRIRQFFSAIFSNITEEDQLFLKKHLQPNEQALFMAMDVPTQKHCLNVAYSCQHLLEKQTGINRTLLLRSALLHDCGKLAGEVKTWHRVIFVVVNKLLPTLRDKLIQRGQSGSRCSLCRAFYINSIHSARGAYFAQQADVELPVIVLIKEHHNGNIKYPPELLILQQADELN
ncbi:HD domain-containing protein [Peptococcaceae bacterium 1198_IL3148]